MTVAFMPDGVTFNGQQDILSDQYVSKLSIGDRLDDPGENPLVFSRAGVAAS
jgi:hypothetical protein